MEHIHEINCECQNCGEKFCYSDKDIAKNKQGRWADLASTTNLIAGNKVEQAIALNHKDEAYQADFNKCPKCGSRKIIKEENDYYVDEDGNYIEDYKPDIIDKTSEMGGKVVSGIGDLAHTGCLILLLIPALLFLYAVFNIVKAVFILFF